MAVFDLHVAAIADEMRVRAGFVIHTVVIDAEYADVLGKGRETTGTAAEAIGGNGGRRVHAGTNCGDSGARIGASAATIDALFIAILHGVGACGCDAIAGLAHTALAIVRNGAGAVGIAGRTIRSTAIDSGFFAVGDAIRAGRYGARAGSTNSARALRAERARFAIVARQTRTAAIDVTFAGVFRSIGAFVADALVHLANEAASTALHAIDTRDARAISVANTLVAIGLCAQHSLHHGHMAQHAVGADVQGAFLRVVVGVIGGNIANIERGIALPFDAIAVELRRKWRAGGLQAFSAAFAIGAFRFATEIGRTIVFAVGGGHAFGHRTATAGTIAAGTAFTAASSASITAAGRAARRSRRV